MKGKISMRRIIRYALFLALAAWAASHAADYPNRPVRVVVGYAAGSGPDIQARTLSVQLSTSLGQQFFVENKLGANGTIAARLVTQAKPDGYTLLFSSSSITPTPHIYKNLGYNLKTDLEPIASIGLLDGMLVLVDAKSPIKSLRDFIEYAKKTPVQYGSPGVGNILHLATEKFSNVAGITMQHVPYKGASEVMAALLGGSIQVMFVTPPSVMSLLKDGRVRALAFTGTKPFPPFADIPLMKDLVPGFEPMGSWGMFFAPAKTPRDVVEKLNSAISKALVEPSVAKVLQRDGYFPDNRNAVETKAFFDKEIDRMESAVKAAGIKPN